MKLYFYSFLIFFCTKANAQFLISSNTSIESCNPVDSCLTVNNISFLFYDESKGEFFLKVDFSNFRSKPDSINNWINKERDTCLYFRIIFPKEKFPVLGTEERQSYTLNGRIYYHNLWKDQSVELTMFNSKNTQMNTTSGSGTAGIDSYKVNFTLPFVPGDFKKYKVLYYNEQSVNINVTLGRINLLKQGMEPLISEVYYQPNR